jgi:hypothetical protein
LWVIYCAQEERPVFGRLRAIEVLRARCTGFAEELLHELEAHPDFPHMVQKLMALKGPVTRSDIERLLLEAKRRDTGIAQFRDRDGP